jgi:pyrroline-5-carboxylate reductase
MNTWQTIGMIGAGRATRFLLEGWIAGGGLPCRVLVTDCDDEVLDKLARDVPGIVRASPAEAAAADLVVLAVHPPVMAGVIASIRPHLRPDAVLLSRAPKIGCAKIAEAAGCVQVVRRIPNAPSAIGRGYNPVTFAEGVDPSAKAALLELARPWGEAPEAPEGDLEAYAILSAMGPTCLWFQWQALRELGRDFGLSADDADRAILRMIEGAAVCLLGSGREPAAVMDMVPVRPLADVEDEIREQYRTRLTALHLKLKS